VELVKKTTQLIVDGSNYEYYLPQGLADRDYVDLLKRACKGSIAAKDQLALLQFIQSIPPSTLNEMQRAVINLIMMETSTPKSNFMSGLSDMLGNGPPIIEVNKYFIDFGLKGRRAKSGIEIRDTITLEAKAGKLKYQFIIPDPEGHYSLNIEPTGGKLKSKELVEITFKLIMNEPLAMCDVVTMDIEGGAKHLFVVKARSEWSNFGCALTDTKVIMAEHSIYEGHPHKVPQVLIKLYDLLVSTHAFDTEEIFRKSLDEEKLTEARTQFDHDEKLHEMTPETISSLIKVWLRELPVRLLNVQERDVIDCDRLADCEKLLQFKISPSHRDIVLWILDLMVKVVQSKDNNRMNTKKLAIVMAPNMFPASQGTVNAEYLRKQAMVFTMLVDRRQQTIEDLI
jgi:hypothetical protein